MEDNAYQLSRKVRKMVMIKYYYEVALVLFWQGKLYEHLMFITQGCELQKMSCAMCNMDRLAPAPSTQLGGLKNCPNWKPNRARQFARHNQAFFPPACNNSDDIILVQNVLLISITQSNFKAIL